MCRSLRCVEKKKDERNYVVKRKNDAFNLIIIQVINNTYYISQQPIILRKPCANVRYSSYIYCRKPSRKVHPVFFRRRRVRCRARFCQLLTIEMRKIRNSNPDFILTFRRFRQRRNIRWIVSTHYSDWNRFASHNLTWGIEYRSVKPSFNRISVFVMK